MERDLDPDGFHNSLKAVEGRNIQVGRHIGGTQAYWDRTSLEVPAASHHSPLCTQPEGWPVVDTEDTEGTEGTEKDLQGQDFPILLAAGVRAGALVPFAADSADKSHSAHVAYDVVA